MSVKRLPLGIFCLIYIVICTGSMQAIQTPPGQRTSRENIVTLMLLRMTQVLDLSEQQTAQLFPLVNRIEKEKLQMLREAGKQLRDLRELLREDDPDPRKLERYIIHIKELRAQIKIRDVEVEPWVNENLTLEQQAKFLIFFQDFNRYLPQKLQEARSQRPPVKKHPAK